jgi:hypothetical protein
MFQNFDLQENSVYIIHVSLSQNEQTIVPRAPEVVNYPEAVSGLAMVPSGNVGAPCVTLIKHSIQFPVNCRIRRPLIFKHQFMFLIGCIASPVLCV